MSSNEIKEIKSKYPGSLSKDKKKWVFPEIKKSNNKTGKTMMWNIYVYILPKNVAKKNMSADNAVPILDEYFLGTPDNISTKYNGYIEVDTYYIHDDIESDADSTASKKPKTKADNTEYAKKPPTVIEKGKNIGKANQTNVFTQAMNEARGRYNKNVKSTSDTEINTLKSDVYLPMLLKPINTYNINKDKDKPLFVQRKYNGIRVVTYKDGMYSRTGQKYTGFDYIVDELMPIIKEYKKKNKVDIYFDGELYKHGESLQDISGHVRNLEKADKSELNLEYQIFDVFIPSKIDMTFEERNKIMDDILGQYSNNKKAKIHRVETIKLNANDPQKDFDKYYEKFLKEKYEGIVLRKGWCPYVYSYNSYHSSNILKKKALLDDEFEIVGMSGEEGKGKSKNAFNFILKTKDGEEFTVIPSIPLEERYTMFEKYSKNTKLFNKEYKGKLLTVYFDELSKKGIPVRTKTNGIIIRDYE